ncbi:MAG: flavodoxin family protein [Aestuariibacter sp.]|nr:flavodoxin family protein [Aestuariibacter sp.]MCP5010016.1 flavodoxin family protein [Aestuariibacter sp.]
MPTKTLLIIAHAPSDNTRQMAEAVERGARHPDINDINVVVAPPAAVQPEDLCKAQAVIIGTTENLGYMAGLTKDLFDRCYYPCLEHTQAMPFSFYIRAGQDGTGTLRAITSVTTGLRWKLVQAPLICKGEFKTAFLAECEALGLTMAASLEAGII